MNALIAVVKRGLTVSALIIGLMPGMSTQAVEQAGKFLEERTVRIVVDYKGTQYISTGFAWRQKDLFITALHGMRPCENCTKVQFKGRGGVNARVISVLRDADLVLLQTDQPIADVIPFDTVHTERPAESNKLAVLGYRGGSTNAHMRYPTMSFSTDPTLRGLIDPPTKASRELEKFQMPKFELPIYYVIGGLFPGYSGGAVVDSQHRLVGVADGGLDKGVSGFNWIIPAKHILELEASGKPELPPEIEQIGLLFSTGLPGKPVSLPDDDADIEWYPLKTRSVEQLLYSTPDPEGLLDLGSHFDIITDHVAPDELFFDLYQEEDLGLIIAVPSSMEMEFDDEDGYLYVVDPSGATGEAYLNFAYNDLEVVDEEGNIVQPDDENFFMYLTANHLEGCEEWVREEYNENATCDLDESIFTNLAFPDGSKMLRFATIAYERLNEEDARFYAYDYLSVAVKNGQTLVANVNMELSPEGGLLQCLIDESYCTDFERGKAQFELLVAAHLTSFDNPQDAVNRN